MVPELKILIAGPMGAGKTTAIRAISDIAPVLTEQLNSERSVCDKLTTTVAMDYGEVDLGGGQRLALYGTPGQPRFDFMWELLGRGALGLVIVLNDADANASLDLARYLRTFSALLAGVPTVIGINRLHGPTSLERYQRQLAETGHRIPVVPADPRERSEVLVLLECLFAQIEVAPGPHDANRRETA